MAVDGNTKKEPFNLEHFLRIKSKGLLDTIAAAVNKTGILPNTVTILGLIGTTAGAVLIGMGHVSWGGLLVLLMGPFDALDGSMARLRGDQTEFGAFVDSVTDRYSELVIFGGLLAYYMFAQNWLYCGLTYLAAAGSILVSYTKARAESLGFTAKVGILTRVERYLIMAPCLLFNIPWLAVWIIAIFANYTALQRILTVRKQAAEQHKLLVYPSRKMN
jgi:CDP-diacylglycerol--glycerol-3-phosphate 3-phosphatidyltransferase